MINSSTPSLSISSRMATLAFGDNSSLWTRRSSLLGDDGRDPWLPWKIMTVLKYSINTTVQYPGKSRMLTLGKSSTLYHSLDRSLFILGIEEVSINSSVQRVPQRSLLYLMRSKMCFSKSNYIEERSTNCWTLSNLKFGFRSNKSWTKEKKRRKRNIIRTF